MFAFSLIIFSISLDHAILCISEDRDGHVSSPSLVESIEPDALPDLVTSCAKPDTFLGILSSLTLISFAKDSIVLERLPGLSFKLFRAFHVSRPSHGLLSCYILCYCHVHNSYLPMFVTVVA